jgi:hypothetical protein
MVSTTAHPALPRESAKFETLNYPRITHPVRPSGGRDVFRKRQELREVVD